MGPFFLEGGKSIHLGQRLGGGGEADIFALTSDSALVAKMYHVRTADRIAKLHVMVANPLKETTLANGHVSICWPLHLVSDGAGATAGFLMRLIEYSQSIPLFKIYNPIDRYRSALGFTWRYLIKAAANIAAMVEI